jgi:uncharacterized membrane protein
VNGRNRAAGQVRRIEMFDELRGLCVLLMVVYHALFIQQVWFQANTQWLFDKLTYFQPLVAAVFIVISGICARLSRDNKRRGIQLAVCALGITLVTGIALPAAGVTEAAILFGILHLLACSKLLFQLMRGFLDRIPAVLGALPCLALFLFTYPVHKGERGFYGLLSYPLPEWLFEKTTPLLILGFHAPGFASLDYFPLLPYFFLFLFGTFLGKFAQNGQFPEFCYRPCVAPFGYIGRHSLLVYFLHAPAIYGLFYVVRAVWGFGG